MFVNDVGIQPGSLTSQAVTTGNGVARRIGFAAGQTSASVPLGIKCDQELVVLLIGPI